MKRIALACFLIICIFGCKDNTISQAAPPWQIDVEAWAHRDFQISHGGPSYSYGGGMSYGGGPGIETVCRLQLRIGNPNDHTVRFDTIVFKFPGSGGATEQHMYYTDEARVTRSFYGDRERTPDEREKKDIPIEITIEGRTAVLLKGTFELGQGIGIYKKAIVVNLLHKGVVVGKPLFVELPDIRALPDARDVMGESKKGMYIKFQAIQG